MEGKDTQRNKEIKNDQTGECNEDEDEEEVAASAEGRATQGDKGLSNDQTSECQRTRTRKIHARLNINWSVRMRTLYEQQVISIECGMTTEMLAAIQDGDESSRSEEKQYKNEKIEDRRIKSGKSVEKEYKYEKRSGQKTKSSECDLGDELKKKKNTVNESEKKKLRR